jgi:hypothetical protein
VLLTSAVALPILAGTTHQNAIQTFRDTAAPMSANFISPIASP